MKRIMLTGALLIGALAAGCSHRVDLTRESSQIDVGVDAAKMNLWREALFRFQRAVQIDPNDAMAHNNLAVAYEGTGDFEKARANYIEALRLDKGNEYIQKNFSRFTEFTSRNKKRGRATATAVKSTRPNASSPAPQPSPSPASPPEGGAQAVAGSPAGSAPTSAPPSGSPVIPSSASPAPAPASPPPAPPPSPHDSMGGSL
jgi:tetratricopeptide (TPR) repeat protein